MTKSGTIGPLMDILKMNRKILLMVLMGFVGLILLFSLVEAYSFKQIFNPFTNRGDFYQDENYTGHGLIADNFTTSSGGLIITDNESWNQSFGDDRYFLNSGDSSTGTNQWFGTQILNSSVLTFAHFSSDLTQNFSQNYNVHSNNSNGGSTIWKPGNGLNITTENGEAIQSNLMDGNNINERLQGNFNVTGLPQGFSANGFGLRIVKRQRCFLCLFSPQIFTDEEVYLTKNGVVVGENKADNITAWSFETFANSSYGGAGDDWGAGIDLDTDTIGFAFSMDSLGASDDFDGDTPEVDLVELIIYGSNGAEYTFKPNPITNEIRLVDGDASSETDIFVASQKNASFFVPKLYVNNSEVCTTEENCQGGVFSFTATVVYNNSAGVNFSLGTDESTHKLTVQGDANITENLDLGKNVTLQDDQSLNLGSSKNGTFYYDSTNGRVVLKVT